MGKVFELVRPNSVTDPTYADSEYLIRWIGRNGADYVFMFYDAELAQGVKASVINERSSTRIESLIDSENRRVTLTADDLSKNDLEIIAGMFINKYVSRIRLDGTIERYAVDSNSFKYTLSELRYSLSFDIINYSRPVWR